MCVWGVDVYGGGWGGVGVWGAMRLDGGELRWDKLGLGLRVRMGGIGPIGGGTVAPVCHP